MLQSCRVLSTQYVLRSRQLISIVSAREQMAMGVRRHADRGMADALLHDL
jgi:hypothetical protein